jgi:hypothetical protein
MLEKTRLRFHRILNAILIAVLASISGVMYVSAHGGDIALIHACVNNRGGALRIVTATTICDANRETALDWVIQGPKGDKGDAGNVGPMGMQGLVGPMGPQGLQGPAGAGINRDHIYSVQVAVIIDPDQTSGAEASCNDSNDILLSGGYDSAGPELDTYRSLPYPYFLNATWSANAINNGSGPATLTVKVLCLRVD